MAAGQGSVFDDRRRRVRGTLDDVGQRLWRGERCKDGGRGAAACAAAAKSTKAADAARWARRGAAIFVLSGGLGKATARATMGQLGAIRLELGPIFAL